MNERQRMPIKERLQQAMDKEQSDLESQGSDNEGRENSDVDQRESAENKAEIKEGLKSMIESADGVNAWIDRWKVLESQENVERGRLMNSDKEFVKKIRDGKAEALKGIQEWTEYAHEIFGELDKMKLEDEEAELMHAKLDDVDEALGKMPSELARTIDSNKTDKLAA